MQIGVSGQAVLLAVITQVYCTCHICPIINIMLTRPDLDMSEKFIRLPPLRLYNMQENTYFAISDLILNSDKLDPTPNTKHTDYEKTLH